MITSILLCVIILLLADGKLTIKRRYVVSKNFKKLKNFIQNIIAHITKRGV